MNSPACVKCNSATSGVGATTANPSELSFRPGVVELYKCTVCSAITRFPRYNHALKLLETRCGRCGEWQQAFALCARSVGYEVRTAADWTDHIWSLGTMERTVACQVLLLHISFTSVCPSHCVPVCAVLCCAGAGVSITAWLSSAGCTWIRVRHRTTIRCSTKRDGQTLSTAGSMACSALCSNEVRFQLTWLAHRDGAACCAVCGLCRGKKLNYVISCSYEEIVDTTQRYTHAWSAVQDRRVLCPEVWLAEYIQSANQLRMASITPQRQTILAARRQAEAIEFANNVHNRPQQFQQNIELIGRTTGSVEWRIQRGELGSTQAAMQRAIQADNTHVATLSSASSTDRCEATQPQKNRDQCSTLPAVGSAAAINSMDILPLNPNSSSASSSSSSIIAAACDPSDAAHASQEAARAKIKQLFQSYVKQLSQGCGHEECTTTFCKSNPCLPRLVVSSPCVSSAMHMRPAHCSLPACGLLSMCVCCVWQRSCRHRCRWWNLR